MWAPPFYVGTNVGWLRNGTHDYKKLSFVTLRATFRMCCSGLIHSGWFILESTLLLLIWMGLKRNVLSKGAEPPSKTLLYRLTAVWGRLVVNACAASEWLIVAGCIARARQQFLATYVDDFWQTPSSLNVVAFGFLPLSVSGRALPLSFLAHHAELDERRAFCWGF